MLVVVCVYATYAYILYYIHICMYVRASLYRSTLIYYIYKSYYFTYMYTTHMNAYRVVFIYYVYYMYRPGGQEVLRQLPYPEGRGAVHTGGQAAHWGRRRVGILYHTVYT